MFESKAIMNFPAIILEMQTEQTIPRTLRPQTKADMWRHVYEQHSSNNNSSNSSNSSSHGNGESFRFFRFFRFFVCFALFIDLLTDKVQPLSSQIHYADQFHRQSLHPERLAEDETHVSSSTPPRYFT